MSTLTAHRFRGATISAVALSFLLVGCGGVGAPIGGGDLQPSGPPSGATESPAEPTEPGGAGGPGDLPAWATTPAQLVMAGQSFSFMTSCTVSEGDILIHGPGYDDDSGELAYLSVDFTMVNGARNGEIRIDLGTDQQFVSSDSIYVSKADPDHE